jgi:hypothetical protein
MVEIVNAVSAGVRRPIQFFHLPVPKPRTGLPRWNGYARVRARTKNPHLPN